MDPITYIRILRGRWKVVALTCFIGVVAGGITSPLAGDAPATGGFSATHVLRVDDEADAEAEAEGSRSQAFEHVGLIAYLATTGEVPARAAAALDTDVASLTTRVRVNGDPELGTLSITALDPVAARAVEIADTFARELLVVLEARAQERYNSDLQEARAVLERLQAEVDDLPPVSPDGRADVENAARAGLLERFSNADLRVQELEAQGPPSAGFVTLQAAIPQVGASGGALAGSGSRQSETGRRSAASQDSELTAPAVPDQRVETAPEPLTRMLIGGAVGLLLGLGLALLRERLDPRIRSREDAERTFGLPVLAEVPQLDRQQQRRPQLATVGNGRALEAESYRVLATSLLFHHPLGAGEAHRGNGSWDDQAPTGAWRRGSSASDGTALGVIEDSNDIRRATNGLTLLGTVPAPSAWDDNGTGPKRLSRDEPDAPEAEAYRLLRIPLGRSNSDGPARTLLVTGASVGEKTTATAANIGVALARDGQRVVIIDGDLLRPRVHAFFDLPNTVGLTSVVLGEVSVSLASQPVTGEAGLSIVAAGPRPADAEGLLASPRISEVLAALAATVDVVIIDSAPILGGGGAPALASRVDGTVLVATRGTSSGRHLRRAVDSLEGVGASLLGVVLHEPGRGGAAGHSVDPTPEGGVILVTSPGAKEGKSTASVNLAVALAEVGKSVLALDFDLRRPRLHQFFGEDPDQPGLADALARSGRRHSLQDIVKPTTIAEVRVALSGSTVPNPSELLPGARTLVAEARREADLIVIDTPPVLVASDAVQLVPAVDAVVLACRLGTTRAAEAVRARQLLARLDAPMLGMVLLGVQPSSAARAYYFDYRRPRSRLRPKDRREAMASLPRDRASLTGTTRTPGSGIHEPTALGAKVGATKSRSKAAPRAASPKAQRSKKKAKQRSSSK